jgi:T5SS/PEP-CTERM-associated repeat protein
VGIHCQFVRKGLGLIMKKWSFGVNVIVGVLLAAGVCLTTRSARAATGTWDGSDGSWDTSATHWSGVADTPWDATDGPTNTASLSSGTANVNGVTVYASNLTMSATVSAHVVITNSGKLHTSGGPSYIGVLNNQNGNRVTVTGDGSVWDNGAKELSFGNNQAPYNGVLAVTDGGVVTNVGTLTLGRQQGTNHWVNITGGGKAFVSMVSMTQNAGYCGVLVSGTDSLLDCNNGGISYTLNAGVLSYSKWIVTDGGVVTNGGLINLNSVGHAFAVTNRGALYSSGATMASSAIQTSILIGSNSLWNAGGVKVYIAGTSNTITVADGGVWTNAYFTANMSGGGSYGNLIVTNGGKAYLGAAANTPTTISGRDGGSSNTVAVTGANSLLNNGGQDFCVAYATYTTGNRNYNSLQVKSGGVVSNVKTLNVGINTNEVGNDVQVTGGGLLEINTGITVGKSAEATSASNSVTVSGGVLQFTNAAPTISVYNTGGSGNSITLTNATLAFRGIQAGAMPNLTNNLAASGSISTNSITYQGNNTYRLDNSFASNSVAAGYTFATGVAYNFAGLELINSTTAIRNKGVTIGATGSLLVSNTTATIEGAFTNNGTLTITNSTLTLASGATVGSGSTLNMMGTNSTINVTGNLMLPATATVNMQGLTGPLPNPFVLFTVSGGSISAPGGVNWTVTGSLAGTRASVIGNQVMLVIPKGVVISVQ